ncbi:MAG: hypothetical protein HRT35_19365 [Algicola sp.]|nr:hypothetical protein [Algicola sp.]
MISKVKQFLEESFLFEFDDEVTDHSDLFKLGIIDSLGYIKLIKFLEREFHIEFSEEDFMSNVLVSFSSIVDYLEAALKEPQNIALLFPGQGAHDFNMLDRVSNLHGFKERHETICDHLGENLYQKLYKKDRDYIDQNKISSILTVLASSVLFDHYLDETEAKAHYYAGYSVGQWTALFAAKSISFEQLIQVLIKRAQMMDECFEKNKGAMMAVIGLKQNVVEDYLAQFREQGHFIEISNFNCVGQLSVSGTKKAIELAYENIASIQPKKSVILPIQGAWHCALLEPAQKSFEAYLQDVDIKLPQIEVVDNCTGLFLPDNVEGIKESLCRHISHPVLWEKGMKHLIAHDCKEFVEVGHGNLLTNFGFFIDRHLDHKSF